MARLSLAAWNLHEVFIPAPGEQEYNFGHDIDLEKLNLLFLMLLEGVVLVLEDELEDYESVE